MSLTVMNRGWRSIKNLWPDFLPLYMPLKVIIGKKVIRFPLRLLARSNSIDNFRAFDQDFLLVELPSGIDGYFVEFCPTQTFAVGLLFSSKYLIYSPYRFTRYYIDFTKGYKNYQNTLPVKKKQLIERKLRKINALSQPGVELKCYDSAETLTQFFTSIKPIVAEQVAKHYQILPTDDIFVENACKAAATGHLKAFILCVDNEPVSYIFCPVSANSLVYEYIGYSNRWSAFSPGFILLWLVIKDSFGRPEIKYFDFTRGSGQQKRFFSTAVDECLDVSFLRKKISLLAYLLLHFTLNKIAYFIENNKILNRKPK